MGLPEGPRPSPARCCPRQPHPKGVPALDVNTVSDPGCPQLPVAPAQQDGGLGGRGARRLQKHLEAAGL